MTETSAETKIEKTQEEDTTIANPQVIKKYQAAADITNRVLLQLVAACVNGSKIIDICTLGDNGIQEGLKKTFTKSKVPKGVAFPTSISVNNVICHFSPLPSDKEASIILKDGDLVKIELGAQVDGYSATVAHTLVVGATKDNPVTGRKADVLQAAHLASEAALRLIKPGNENMKVTDVVQKISEAFETKPVEGMLSHQQERNETEGKKQIILNPNEPQKRQFQKCQFEENEVYAVDILISSGEGKPKPSEFRTTIFKKTGTTYQLKMKSSRAVITEISTKFGKFPFSLREMSDEKVARLGIIECTKHGIVTPYEVYQEKEGEIVAQFLFTVLLLPDGPHKLTSPIFDSSIIRSDKSLEDKEILDLLKTGAKPKKKKNNKKKTEDTSTTASSSVTVT